MQGALLGGVVIGVLDTFGKVLFPQFGLFTMYLAMVDHPARSDRAACWAGG